MSPSGDCVLRDLPTLAPADLRAAVALLADPAVDIGTLAAEIVRPDEATNPNVVKLIGSPISSKRLRALYFTRATAPSGEGPLYHHIGLYAYRRAALMHFVALPPSALEQRERLEQLRALEAGMRIDASIVESVPLVLLSAVAGLALAHWSFTGLVAMVPFGIPRRAEIAVGAPALIFGLLVSCAAGLLFAVAPALQTSTEHLTTELNAASRTVSGRDGGLRKALVAGQFALALALLSCAGLLAKSFVRLAQVEAGRERDGTGEVMQREHEPARMDERRDGLHGRNPAAPGDVDVAVVHSATVDEAGERVDSSEALAGANRRGE